MSKELRFHFHPAKGWMNDPNGLCFYQGKYHAFFQHNPYSTKWDTMHWGHAVTTDLLHWEELPIALYPTELYENAGGCFSGSAVIHNDLLYLFYTSVSKEMGQTQSLVTSCDGKIFKKAQENPLIRNYPPDGSADFRDPKVFRFQDSFYMVCGSGKEGIGRILLYQSEDLLHWTYKGILLEGREYGGILECPDLFPLEDRWVLLFSQMGRKTHSVAFCVGQWSGGAFQLEQVCFPEVGPQFYAPQTFQAPDGRRLLIAWMYDWDRTAKEGERYVGAFTVPRELYLTKQHTVAMRPVREAQSLLLEEDSQVRRGPGFVEITGVGLPLRYNGIIEDLKLLRDGDALEVFINGGTTTFTVYQP